MLLATNKPTKLIQIGIINLIRLILYFLLSSSLLFSNLYSQNERSDSLKLVLKGALSEEERINNTQLLFGSYVFNKPDSALKYAKLAFDLSESYGNDSIHGQSIMDLTHAYFVNNQILKAKSLLKSSIPFYNKSDNHLMVGACYRNLAVIGEALEQPDTSLFYLDRCIEYLTFHPDSITLGDALLSKGFAYRTKGYYELSIEALLESRRIFDLIGNDNRLGYVHQNIGITFAQASKFDQAAEHMSIAIDYFTEYKNLQASAQSLNNVGSLQRKAGNYGPSISSHLESIKLSKQTKQLDVELNNALNLARTYKELTNWDSVSYWTGYATPIAEKLNDNFSLGVIKRLNAKKDYYLGSFNSALSNTKNAETLFEEYPDPVKLEETYNELSELFELLGDTKKGLYYYKEADNIQDSLFTLKQVQQVDELNLIYKTEKKDAEIKYLNKEAELDATRKRALWGGILLLSISGLSIIYSIIQRAKKKRLILEKEKELEVQKRESTERELEYKQKELTAKVLQLASKNEFLLKLEEEVSDLKSSVDATVSKTSQRISRMIGYDSSDDQEWEQFGKEFSSIHSSFLERLREQFGKFSKSEMRLISLLKMNLSSKEIANTLRISDDGVKKARYRLRKKMQLNSDIDIQQYLLNY